MSNKEIADYCGEVIDDFKQGATIDIWRAHCIMLMNIIFYLLGKGVNRDRD